MTACSAFILAGGLGRRLSGRVKPLVEVGGHTILARQVETLAALGLRPSLVAPDPRPFAHLDLEVVKDDVTAGALGGLYTALRHARESHVVVLAGDMPFVSAPFLAHLIEVVADHDAAVPNAGGLWHPLCAVYHRRAAAQLRRAIDDGRWRVIDAIAPLDVRPVVDDEIAPFDRDGRLLLNVNTPDDYRRADPRATL